MVRVVLWELRKIIGQKLLWLVILLCVVFAVMYDGPESYRYEYGKRFDERELYQYSLIIKQKYPGALNQYSEEIKGEYNKYKTRYEHAVNNCESTEYNECVHPSYQEFMKSENPYYLVLYKDIMDSIIVSETNDKHINNCDTDIKKNVLCSQNEKTLKSKFLTLKLERLNDLEEQKSVYINHEYVIVQYIEGVIVYSFLILIVLLVALIPVYTYDYDYRTNYLIGSSKSGRLLILNKLLASVLFTSLIYILFFLIHYVKFVFKYNVLYNLSDPMYGLNNSELMPWSDLSIIQFIIYYWGYIFILMIISVCIILLISKLTKKVTTGVLVTVLYFVYPFIIENLLHLNLGFNLWYIVTYLNVAKVFEHSDKLLLIGSPYHFREYDSPFWGRDVIMFNVSLILVFIMLLSYRFIKKVDIN